MDKITYELQEAVKAVAFDTTNLNERFLALASENAALKDHVAALSSEVVSLSSRVARDAFLRRNEKYYQTLLEGQLGGKHLSIPNVGITDITTEDSHVEIKHWKNYHSVPGQLQKYHMAVPRKRKCVYLFGKPKSGKRLQQIIHLFALSNIEMYWFGPDDEILRPADSQPSDASEIVQRFVHDCMVLDTREWIEWTALSRAFKKWSAEHEYVQGREMKRDTMKTLFAKYGVKYAQPKVDGKTVTRVIGWKMNLDVLMADALPTAETLL